MITITLEEYPHRKRWMHGTIVKEQNRMKWEPWNDELKKLIEAWFIKRFDTQCEVDARFIFIISSSQSELRTILFLRQIRIYDVRIIHLRLHREIDASLIKLKISFKRQGMKYYEHIKVLTRIAAL